MGIVYRRQKGEPLTIEEMDGNFANLDSRIKSLETNPSLSGGVAEGVASVTQEGDRLTIHGSFGTVLGQVTLPKAFPNPRGKWTPETAYYVMDWVQEKGGIYSCLSPHRSTEFETDKENWALVFQG
jgi:hypothetical protein